MSLLAFNILQTVSANDNTTNTGNELITVCNDKNHQADNVQWAWCMGFVEGVETGVTSGIKTTALVFMKKPNQAQINAVAAVISEYCTPTDVTREQMAMVVAKYLADHPEKLNEPSYAIVVYAFQGAWPCPTEDQNKK